MGLPPRRRVRRIPVQLLVAFVGVMVLAGVALAANPRDLDGTFGDGGTASIPVPPGATGSATSTAQAIAVTPTGKYVLAGAAQLSSGPGALVRLTHGGALDTSFDGDGRLYSTFASRFNDVVVQADHAIVAVGQTTGNQAVIARYAADGTPDATFNGDGNHQVLPATHLFASFEAVVPSGTGFVAAGWTQPSGGVYRMLVARFASDGTLDPTFGTSGVTTVAGFPANATHAYGLLLDGTDIVLAGQDGSAPNRVVALARLTSTGGLDNTTTPFDTDGRATLAVGDSGAREVTQHGTGYVVGGFANATQMLVARFTSAGALDTTVFAAPGYTATDLGQAGGAGGQAIRAENPALDTSALLVAGWSGSPSRMTLARFLANGSLDTGANGVVRTAIGSGEAAAHDLINDGAPDLNWVTAGYCGSGTALAFAAARYLSGSTAAAAGAGGACTTSIATAAAPSGGGGGSAPPPATTPAPPPPPPAETAPAPPPPDTRPLRNVRTPSIAGPAYRRGTLRVADNGEWEGAPASFSYEWQQCHGPDRFTLNCSAAEGQVNGSTYTVPRKMSLGMVLRVRVTAHRGEEKAQADSNATAPVRVFTWPRRLEPRQRSDGSWRFTALSSVESRLESAGACLVSSADRFDRCGADFPILWERDPDDINHIKAEYRDDIRDQRVWDTDHEAGDTLRPYEQVTAQYYEQDEDEPGGRCVFLRGGQSRDDVYVELGNRLGPARARLERERCRVAEDSKTVVGSLDHELITGVELDRERGLVVLKVQRPHPCVRYLRGSGQQVIDAFGTDPDALRAKLIALKCSPYRELLGERAGLKRDRVASVDPQPRKERIVYYVERAPSCRYGRMDDDEATRVIGRGLAQAIDRLAAQNCVVRRHLREAEGQFDDYVERVRVDQDWSIDLDVVTAKPPECQRTVSFGPITAEGGCLKREGMTWTSTGSVAVLGFKLVPNGAGAKIVIDPLNLRIAASGRAKVAIGPGQLLGRSFDEKVLYEGSFEWVLQGSPDRDLAARVMDQLRNRLSGGGAPADGIPRSVVNLPALPGLPKLGGLGLPDFSTVRLPKLLANQRGVDSSVLSIPTLNEQSVQIPAGLIPNVALPPMCFDTGAVGLLGGQGFSGKGCATFEDNERVRLTGELKVPLVDATATATIVIHRDGRIEAQDVRAGVGEVVAGPVTIRDSFVRYTGADDRWHGEGHATLFGLSADAVRADASFDVVAGRLANGSMTVDAGVLGIPLGPTGVFLSGAGVTYQTFPSPLIGGRLIIGFGPSVGGKRLLKLDAGVSYDFAPQVLTIDGKLYVLGASDDVLSGVVRFSPTQVDFTSNFHYGFKTDGFYGIGKQSYDITAKLGGFISGSKFQIDGYAAVYLNGPTVQAEATVTNKGIAACASAQASGKVELFGRSVSWDFRASGGVGYLWQTKEVKPFGGGSCGMDDYRIAPSTIARAAQGGRGRTIDLPRGLPVTSLLFVGESGPPKVILTGPGGERYATPADLTPVADPADLILQDPDAKTTTIMLAAPAGGRWTATLAPGSPAIKQLLKADALPDVGAQVRVSGRGQRRTLTYDVKRIAGQRVVFREIGRGVEHVIGEAAGGTGRLRFAPAPGRRERRRVVAAFEQDGLAREQRTVAHYVAPGTFLPRRPARVRLRRKGSRLVVTWSRSAGARGYVVRLAYNDGARRTLRLGVRAKRRVTVAGVRRGRPASASVAGVGQLDRLGASRRARSRGAPLRVRRSGRA